VSALPLKLRPAPVELLRTKAPPLTVEAAWPAFSVKVPATLLCTPLAMSIAVNTSPTEAFVTDPR
jgi:hypothetical protein